MVNKSKGGAQPNINQTILKETLIPLPPNLEQRRIINKLEEELRKSEETINLLEKVEYYLESMRESLLQQAFRGELVEQRPEEGTGSDLLSQLLEDKLSIKS